MPQYMHAVGAIFVVHIDVKKLRLRYESGQEVPSLLPTVTEERIVEFELV